MRFSPTAPMIALVVGTAALPKSSLSAKRQALSYEPIDSAASEGARELLAQIQNTYSSATYSGQQDPADYVWVETNVGASPAMIGLDFMDYSPSRVEHGTSSTAVEDAIDFVGNGAIATFCWHWNAPTDLYDNEEHDWSSGFYTEATSFDVAAALSSNGTNYDLLLRDIDAIADEIRRLDEAGVSFLWRPLHEPDGAWFWWGAKGAEPFKELWDLLYDRITNYHGLHNMVWVCNTEDSGWYPGNDKCDIVTTDIYADAGDHGTLGAEWDTLTSLSGGEKVLALAEVGVIPDADQMQADGHTWAYWMTWGGEFINDGNYNSADFLASTYHNSFVLTRDDL